MSTTGLAKVELEFQMEKTMIMGQTKISRNNDLKHIKCNEIQ